MDNSEASSDASSDLYATEDLMPPATTTAPTQAPEIAMLASLPSLVVASVPDSEEEHDDDSSSEMSLEELSRPATPEPAPAPELEPPATTTASHVGAKRKLSHTLVTDIVSTEAAAGQAKKPRITPREQANGHAPRTVHLPPELWQRVFMHLAPAMLCRCLRVCKDFNLFLTGIGASQSTKKGDSKVHVMESEAIWIHSRKTYFPILPRPLAGLSELAMLQLVGGRTCQFCGRLPAPMAVSSHLNAGPGLNGLRVIWPFGIRCCGTCLEPRIMKDVQVLATPYYKDLRFGVPHGFRSLDLHFASESVRQLPGGIPGQLRFSKINYIPDLQAIKEEEENAKTLGDGAADEWRKGLPTRGKEAMADSARWEKWELQMRPGVNHTQVLREYDLSSFPRSVAETQHRSAAANNSASSSWTPNGAHPLPRPVHVFPGQVAGQQATQPPSQPQQYHRPARNPIEIEETRQARKAEIERRCRGLEPPLEPNVLQHMETFHAAMQISTPLTDAAWEVLKPRILGQRETAELMEHERASQLALLQAALPSTISEDVIPRPARETYDRDYEQAQEPLRKRLGEYADDYINGHWSGGKMLEKDNAPIFAIHVLLQVRKRYYEDKSQGLLPHFDAPRSKDPSKQSTPPLEPFLSLDNMKWVFDNKVKPLTEVHRRELFLCAGCSDEKKAKWFAFEGLIQHYGAKHTTAFSKGNIVVHWQTADWPDEPPFHKNPAHWLKVDRRTADLKNHGRLRNTPQNSHRDPFQAPQVPSPQDHPHHTSHGFVGTAQGHSATYFSSAYAQPGKNENSHFQQMAVRPIADLSYETQVSKLAGDAREIWGSLDGVQNLEESIRMQTVIYHAATRFFERFRQQPQLDMMIDALASNELRPIKNAYGLACKSCVAMQANGSANNRESYWVRIHSAKRYITSTLITHFQLVHAPQGQAGYLDWTKDMIECPENSIVQELFQTPGMDDDKLALIAAAFPTAFTAPLPRIGTVTAENAKTSAEGALSSRLLERLSKKPRVQPKKKKNQKRVNDTNGNNGAFTGNSETHDSFEPDDAHDALPEPGEDEYDPRRPMFTQSTSLEPAASRFDTDASRNHSTSVNPPGDLTLDPETLAFLASMESTAKAATTTERLSRSPSIGRSTPSSKTPGNQPPLAPPGQPDISAILQQLLQNQPAVPQPSLDIRRTGSAGREPIPEPRGRHFHESPPTQKGSARGPGTRYSEIVSPPLPGPTVGGLQELQAALSHNNRRFEANQQATYVETPYAPAAQPSPRYHYVYEGEQHRTQSSTSASLQREAPVQYVQLPEREPALHGYHYERAHSKPIYVDQYGRPLELIQIDSAPAPVQYMSSPEHPHYRHPDQSVYATHYQPVYERPVYYEPQGQRYAYDDGRGASVPRS